MTKPGPHTETELVELIRSSEVRAPEALHSKVESLIAERSGGARRGGLRVGSGRPRLGLGLAGSIAVAAVLLVVIVTGLSGGAAHTLSVRQASALTLGGATMPAPVHSVSHSGRLNTAVDGVYFPYWEDHFGWRSTGTRTDHVDGRAVTTVFYQDSAGQRVGYAIVAGTPSPRMSGGTVALRGGVPYRMITVNGVHVICWMRNGHLCVVGARGVSSATLLKLASWSGEGAVAS